MKSSFAPALIIFCSLAAYAETASRPDASYCPQLIPDLKFIHRQLAENSANVRYSTETARQADAALEAGISAADNCKGETDYIRGIKKYVASYHDPHLTVSLNPAGLKGTGLVFKKLNDRYFIGDKISGMASPGNVAAGDELVSCRSKTPLNILENEILPFESYFDKEAALYKYARSGWSLRYDVNDGEETSCEFRRGSKTFEARLRWQPVSGDALLRIKESFAKRPIYAFERIDGAAWVTFASFDPKGPEETRLLIEFVDGAKQLRGEKKIVLDLRGNGGGNSDWGDRWLRNLIGYVPKAAGRTLIWTSKDNTGYYESFAEKYSAEGGLSAEDKKGWAEFATCLKSKADSFLECGLKLESSGAEPVQPTGFKGRIILLTDAGCFSSCEDFTLTLRLTGAMRQAGLATDASAPFGDVRFGVKTPSGLAKLNFPQAVFLIEGQGQGPLKPDIRIDYNIDEEVKGIDSIKAAAIGMLRDGKL